jgi:hypothetical protein
MDEEQMALDEGEAPSIGEQMLANLDAHPELFELDPSLTSVTEPVKIAGTDGKDGEVSDTVASPPSSPAA